MQLLCLNCVPSISCWTYGLILPLQPLHNFPSQFNGGRIRRLSTEKRELAPSLKISLSSLLDKAHIARHIREAPDRNMILKRRRGGKADTYRNKNSSV